MRSTYDNNMFTINNRNVSVMLKRVGIIIASGVSESRNSIAGSHDSRLVNVTCSKYVIKCVVRGNVIDLRFPGNLPRNGHAKCQQLRNVV